MKPDFSAKTQDYAQAVAACHFSVSLAQHSKAETALQECAVSPRSSRVFKRKVENQRLTRRRHQTSPLDSVSTNPACCTQVNREGSRVQKLRQYTINARSRNACERQRTASCKTYAESTGRSRLAILLDDWMTLLQKYVEIQSVDCML